MAAALPSTMHESATYLISSMSAFNLIEKLFFLRFYLPAAGIVTIRDIPALFIERRPVIGLFSFPLASLFASSTLPINREEP
jgi:hypothetical protein